MRHLNKRWIIDNSAVGTGAFADVFKGYDGDHEMNVVAVKVFKGVRADNPVLQKSFQNELRAFDDLRHVNVLEFIDWGEDEDRHPYLVLAWVPRTLKAYVGDNRPEGWDDFAPMALAILRGLAHIHERGHVHRDIKPANILVTDDGVPKISDFGISRLCHSVVYDKVTFMNAGTPAYKPPATLPDGSPADVEEAMTYRFDRDVYAYAAVVVEVLAGRELEGEGDAENALEECDLHPQVYGLLKAALSRDPKDRPPTAGDLLRRLESFQTNRESHWQAQVLVPVRISRRAVEKVAVLTGMTAESAEAFILEDLNGDVTVTTMDVGDKLKQGQYRTADLSVVGTAFKYRLRQDSQDPSHLVVIGAVKNTAFNDSDREYGYRDNLVFRPHTQCTSTSREVIDRLFDCVAEHVEERLVQERGDVVRQLFSRWSKVLWAKKLFEDKRGRPIHYSGVEVEGRRVWLGVGSTASGELDGEPRVIRLGDRRSVHGEVERVTEGRLALYVESDSLDDIPESGELQYDTDAAKTALNRQESALNAVKHGRSVRADLRDLLARPSEAVPPRPVDELDFFQADLDESKRAAVRAALGLQDIMVVEGPPGTGKTTFIAELIAQHLARFPGSRVLLSSQTHAALDNALGKVHALCPDLRLVRLGRAERISADVDHLRLEPQLQVWKHEVLAASQQYMQRKAAEWGIDASQAEILSLATSVRDTLKGIADIRSQVKRSQDERRVLALQVEKLNALAPDILAVAERLEGLLAGASVGLIEDGARAYVDTGLELAAALESGAGAAAAVVDYDQRLERLTADLRTAVAEERELRLRLATLLGRPGDEAGDVDALLDAASHYRVDDERLAALDDLHKDWRRRFGKSHDFAAALVASADVVASTCVGGGFGATSQLDYDLCIIDEISKATPTEALIPMARSRRWVLVGDRRQLPPYQEAALAGEPVREIQDLPKEALAETLLDRLVDTLPGGCRFVLTEQHRMTPAIGDLISECFYEGQLHSVGKDMPDFVLQTLGKPVVWIDTSRSDKRNELRARGSTSFSNEIEADEVRTLLTNLAFRAQGQPFSAAVLTGYADQRELLHKVLNAAAGALENVHYEVATVDAFQGREADVCIFSLVRSNDRGELGFLTYRQRINVALSRGCSGLAVVGDASFIDSSAAPSNPLRDVLRYIVRTPEDCAIREVEA